MTERPAPDGNGHVQPFVLLRAELSTLLREIPGGYRRLSARLGDCAVEVTWPDPPPAERSGDDVCATCRARRIEDGTRVAQPAGDEIRAVRAPLVGTVYRAPEPGGRPFVELGDRVVAGQVVAVIEAMKLMNDIETPWSGTLSEILVDDAVTVEFGQALMRIKPDEA